MHNIKILFVCMGNICRSPTAEGVLRHLLRNTDLEPVVEIDSAGTHAYHVGEPPDLRSQLAAKKRGIDISNLRARTVCANDFVYYDYILAMGQDNYQYLLEICPQEFVNKIALFMNYAPQLGKHEVPDPYFGGTNGFNNVLNLINAASVGLIRQLKL